MLIRPLFCRTAKRTISQIKNPKENEALCQKIFSVVSNSATSLTGKSQNALVSQSPACHATTNRIRKYTSVISIFNVLEVIHFRTQLSVNSDELRRHQ